MRRVTAFRNRFESSLGELLSHLGADVAIFRIIGTDQDVNRHIEPSQCCPHRRHTASTEVFDHLRKPLEVGLDASRVHSLLEGGGHGTLGRDNRQR